MSAEPPDGPPSRDEYVSKYMEGGAALALSKKRMPGWFFALLGIPASVVLVATLAAASSAPWMLLVGLGELALLAAIALVFSHLRVVVTATVLHVQLGVWGPKIPIERITSIRAKLYDWKQYGGWGIRYGRDGSWCYSVPGGSNECIEVEWTDDKGRAVKHVVSTEDAAGVVAAVERARAALGAGASGVRVDASSPAAESGQGEGLESEGAERGEGGASVNARR